MNPRILITGGAGFVGSHLADELLMHGWSVRVLDALAPQVHGAGARRPEYLSDEVELMVGDVRDPRAVARALQGVDAVVHLAASVGVGQSMCEMTAYTSSNGVGTAVLLEVLMQHPVERLVVASSMSIYGEGLYRASDGTVVAPAERMLEQLKRHEWEVMRPGDAEPLTPIRTPETKWSDMPSIYAISKYHQERMCMVAGRAGGIPTVGLRFFNIYGARQALSNPHTGVLAIFASRLLNDRPPLINEDGRQRRDFVSVHDAARACRLAVEVPDAGGHVLNIGSGRDCSVAEIAEMLGRAMGKEQIEPETTGRYRMGDIRNCFADISLAGRVLGYRPQVVLEDGLAEFADWLAGQPAVEGTVGAAVTVP